MKLNLSLRFSPAPTITLRDFVASETASASTGLITLPAWLAISCATTGRTTQTSSSTLVTGLGANAARARNTGLGSGWGLSVEAARTNYVRQSNDMTVTAGGVWTALLAAPTVAQVAGGGPGGETISRVTYSAVTRQDRGNFFPKSAVDGGTDPAGQYSISIWYLKNAGTTPTKTLETPYYSDTGQNFTPGATWARADHPVTNATHATGIWLLDTITPTGGTVDYVYAQAENGTKYPGSAIATTSAAVSRAADVLTCGTPGNIAPSGFFNLDLTVAPNYTQAEQSADHDLVYFDANNRIYIKQSDNTVRLRLGGSDVASGALTWAREDAIRVQAQHRRTGKRIIVSKNGVVVYESGALSAATAISLPASVGILGNGTTTPECADLRRLLVLRP